MTDSFVWDAGRPRGLLVEELRRRMLRAVLFVEAEAKKSVSRPNPKGTDPSLPGEPPKRRKGQLRANIASEVEVTRDAVIGRVGIRKGSTASKYGRALELGFHGLVKVPEHVGYRFTTNTHATGRGIYKDVRAGSKYVNLAARPFLRPAVVNNRDAIAARLFGKK